MISVSKCRRERVSERERGSDGGRGVGEGDEERKKWVDGERKRGGGE